MSQASHETVVLVVGAGPTGLLLASELSRRGVPCHLIDAKSGPLHWDRATVVHPRSLQIFESMGLVDKFLAAGCRQRTIKVHSNGELLGTIDLAGCGSVYGFNVGLSEEVTESILTSYLHQHGGQVNRSSRLIGLTITPNNRVLAEIERDGSRHQVEARWIVGCDGIHSATRDLAGIAFEGHDIAKPWAVFDASLEGWADTFEANFVYLESLPVILTALPGHRWRVYLRPDSDHSDLVADAVSTLRGYLPSVSFVDVENPARFRCHTKIAAKYRSGPIFLAGDAAHLCSPGEGHGMNCGLQDAFNLAWKLALVHQGAAHDTLLDSYEIERRPVAELVTKSGDDMEHTLTMTDPTERQTRDQAIKTGLADPEIRHHDMVAEAELNIDYAHSPIIFGDLNSSFAAGYRLPDNIPVRLPEGTPSKLHALGHRAGNTLILLGGPDANLSAWMALHSALQEYVKDSTLFETAVALRAGTNGLDPIDQVGHLDPSEMSRLGIEGSTLLAVRPDGYVGLRSDQNHLAALESYAATLQTGVVQARASN
jgi:2-polyprenyl-6-methoxyphenol hydroxylase-like FAD-dependent oxidoreductase